MVGEISETVVTTELRANLVVGVGVGGDVGFPMLPVRDVTCGTIVVEVCKSGPGTVP